MRSVDNKHNAGAKSNQAPSRPYINTYVNVSEYNASTRQMQNQGQFILTVNRRNQATKLTVYRQGAQNLYCFDVTRGINWTLQNQIYVYITDPKGVQWLYQFKDTAQAAQATAAIGLLMSVRKSTDCSHFDTNTVKTGQPLQLGDNVNFSFVCFAITTFPFVECPPSSEEKDCNSQVTKDKLPIGLVNGMLGMTVGSTRAIYVPSAMSALEGGGRDPRFPPNNLMVVVTIKANNSSSQSPPAEGSQQATSTQSLNDVGGRRESAAALHKPNDEISSAASASDPHHRRQSEYINPHAKKKQLETQDPVSIQERSRRQSEVSLIPDSNRRLSNAGNEPFVEDVPHFEPSPQEDEVVQPPEDDIDPEELERKQRISKIMKMGGVASAFAAPPSVSDLGERRRSSGVSASNTYSDSTEQNFRRPSNANMDDNRRRPSNATIEDKSYSRRASEIPNLPSHTESSSNRRRYSQAVQNPRAPASDEERLNELEKSINHKLDLLTGGPGSNDVMRGVSCMTFQLQEKIDEIDRMKHEIDEFRSAGSISTDSFRELDNLKRETEMLRKENATLKNRISDNESRLNVLEKQRGESSEHAKNREKQIIKQLMGSAFDDISNLFAENKKYSGANVSEQLYNILRKHSFAAMDDINKNGLF